KASPKQVNRVGFGTVLLQPIPVPMSACLYAASTTLFIATRSCVVSSGGKLARTLANPGSYFNAPPKMQGCPSFSDRRGGFSPCLRRVLQFGRHRPLLNRAGNKVETHFHVMKVFTGCMWVHQLEPFVNVWTLETYPSQEQNLS